MKMKAILIILIDYDGLGTSPKQFEQYFTD